MKQAKKNTNQNNKIDIENKIVFAEKVYSVEKIPQEHIVAVEEDSVLKRGAVLTKYDTKIENINIDYSGSLKVQIGDHVVKGDIISQEGKIFKKFYKTNTTGIIVEIGHSNVVIEPLRREHIHAETKMLFDGKIEKITGDKIIISNPGIILNLFSSKGDSCVGKLKYISSAEFRTVAEINSNLAEHLVITDHLTPEIYPMLSAIGAKGVIANSIDYSIYSEMIILAVPVGIISGYGHLPEDQKLLTFLRSCENLTVKFDTQNNKLFIPIEKEPLWLKKYKFALQL